MRLLSDAIDFFYNSSQLSDLDHRELEERGDNSHDDFPLVSPTFEIVLKQLFNKGDTDHSKSDNNGLLARSAAFAAGVADSSGDGYHAG